MGEITLTSSFGNIIVVPKRKMVIANAPMPPLDPKISIPNPLDGVINYMSITKLTVGNLSVIGTITAGGGLVTGGAGTNRIEINPNYIAGYNAGNTLQFYLSASDGKAYCGAGAVVLDSSGITITGSALFFYHSATKKLEIYANNDNVRIREMAGGELMIVAPYSGGYITIGASSATGSVSIAAGKSAGAAFAGEIVFDPTVAVVVKTMLIIPGS